MKRAYLPVSHYQSSIIVRLLDGVVFTPFKSLATAKHGEELLEVASETGNQGDDGE